MAGLKKMFNSQQFKLAKYAMLSLWSRNTQIACSCKHRNIGRFMCLPYKILPTRVAISARDDPEKKNSMYISLAVYYERGSWTKCKEVGLRYF